jgi:hypothetical protein
MTNRTHASRARHTEPAAILCWIFLRGTKAITCEIRVNGRQSHDVCVMPHWDLSSSIVERYDRAAHALSRHAEISRRFREAGWTLIRQVPRRDAHAA